jgi:hypothetical protein
MIPSVPGMAGLQLSSPSATYIVKIFCGSEAPSISQPFADLGQALRWITANAWKEFDGYADRADILVFEMTNRRLALREARAGAGKLARTVARPPTPEERRRAARMTTPARE